MSITDYSQILAEALKEFKELSRERERIDARLFTLRQFVYATVNMLPDEERANYQAELAELAAEMGNLTDSVRETLKLAAQRNSYLTATEVRDRLKSAGFDFSQYASNPLASVSAVLRRFKPGQVETISREGVTAYRWATGLSADAAGQPPRVATRTKD
jgi:hypothetical protein